MGGNQNSESTATAGLSFGFDIGVIQAFGFLNSLPGSFDIDLSGIIGNDIDASEGLFLNAIDPYAPDSYGLVLSIGGGEGAGIGGHLAATGVLYPELNPLEVMSGRSTTITGSFSPVTGTVVLDENQNLIGVGGGVTPFGYGYEATQNVFSLGASIDLEDLTLSYVAGDLSATVSINPFSWWAPVEVDPRGEPGGIANSSENPDQIDIGTNGNSNAVQVSVPGEGDGNFSAQNGHAVGGQDNGDSAAELSAAANNTTGRTELPGNADGSAGAGPGRPNSNGISGPSISNDGSISRPNDGVQHGSGGGANSTVGQGSGGQGTSNNHSVGSSSGYDSRGVEDLDGPEAVVPLIFDLDGDGIEVNFAQTVRFDMDNDGYKELTSWAAPDDGFLVIDLAADGSLSGGDSNISLTDELVLGNWAQPGATDLQGLAVFDASLMYGGDQDGSITSDDGIWEHLRIWQDVNSNGTVENGELQTLNYWDIEEISLSYDDGTAYDDTANDVTIFGNTLSGAATYTLGDGTQVEGGVGDFALASSGLGIREIETPVGKRLQSEDGTVFDTLDASTLIDGSLNLLTEQFDGADGDSRENILSAQNGMVSVVISGGAGNDKLTGGHADDVLIGGSGDDELKGGVGNDVIYVDRDDSLVKGGLGIDTVIAEGDFGISLDMRFSEIEVAFGGDYSDTFDATGSNYSVSVASGGGNDNVLGGNQDDVLNTGPGADNVTGGRGDDRISTGDGNDDVDGGRGSDVIELGSGDDDASGGTGDDIIAGDKGNDSIDGDSGDDRLSGGEGSDTVVGGSGDDLISGGAGNDTLIGNDGDDFITGGDGADTIHTDAGDDIVDAGAGADEILVRGGGDDWINAGAGADLIDIRSNAGSHVILGGTQQDRVLLSGLRSDYTFSYETHTAGGLTFTSHLFVGLGLVLRMQDVEVVEFSDGDNKWLQGRNTALDTSEYFDPEAVSISNSSGDLSKIYTTGPNNTINAGAGSDFVQSDNADQSGQDVVNLGSGRDTVLLVGGNDTGNGGSGADLIMGDAGNDTLNGGWGADEIIGGTGDDTISGWSGADVVRGGDGDDNILGGTGSDKLKGDNGHDRIEGGDGSDILYGNSGNDELFGDDGADYLNGGIGSDTLHGGDGADLLIGREGNDILYGDFGDDELRGSEGNDDLFGSHGNDLLLGGAGDDDLSGDLGDDRLEGWAGTDTLNGGKGQDYLDGGWGNDTLRGDDGNDVLVGGEGADVLDGGAGNLDFADYSLSDDRVVIDLLQGFARSGHAANDTLLNIEGVIGTNGDDRLFGDGEDNVLVGGTGVDRLLGRAGNDVLNGGEGDDSAEGGDGHDEIIGGLGHDTLKGDAGNDELSGGQGRDYLRGGIGDDRLYGGGNRDILEGGDGDDTLDGGEQRDVLQGGAGNDTMAGGGDIDRFIVDFGQTGDIITDFQPAYDRMDLGSGDHTVLVAKHADGSTVAIGGTTSILLLGVFPTQIDADSFLTINGTVTVEIDGVHGSSGNDVMNLGYTDADGMQISDGDDIIFGGDGDDLIYGRNGDDFIFGGDGNDTISGSKHSNVIFGEAGDDILSTGQHSSTMYGGDGDDRLIANATKSATHTMTGGIGSDTFVVDLKSTTVSNIIIADFEHRKDILQIGTDVFDFAMPLSGVTMSSTDQQDLLLEYGNGDKITLVDAGADGIVEGTSGDDSISVGYIEIIGDQVTEGNDVIYAGLGNDVINSGGGNDLIAGQEGDDLIYGSKGSNELFGGAGDDYIHTGRHSSLADGGAGDDTLYAMTSKSVSHTLTGGYGQDDFIFGGISSSRTNDSVVTDFQHNHDALYLNGDEVNAVDFHSLPAGFVLVQTEGDLVVSNSTGGYKVTLSGAGTDDIVSGTAGDDIISVGYTEILTDQVTDGADMIVAGDGDDIVNSGRGNDEIHGGAGNDQLYGGRQSNKIYGGEGDDYLHTGRNSSVLHGGTGDDVLVTMGVKASTHTLSGGIGADEFHFVTSSKVQHHTILDFEVDIDKLFIDDVEVAITSNAVSMNADGSYELALGANGNTIIFDGGLEF